MKHQGTLFETQRTNTTTAATAATAVGELEQSITSEDRITRRRRVWLCTRRLKDSSGLENSDLAYKLQHTVAAAETL